MKILVYNNENDNYVNNALSNAKKLLHNIKSKYIIQIIFSNLSTPIKLKTIKYNKNLQNKINIKLIDYKYYSRRYILYEDDGKKGKEYFYYDDTLNFEGDYLKGERNGKGKEYYYDGQLEFEGEYLNGKRNGKGKEYYNNGEIKFDGEI